MKILKTEKVALGIFPMINKKFKNKENKESCTLVRLILHGTQSSRLESKGGVQSSPPRHLSY